MFTVYLTSSESVTTYGAGYSTLPEMVLEKPNSPYDERLELYNKARKLVKTYRGECVMGAKTLVGYVKSIGWAGDVLPTKTTPEWGDIAIFTPRGHVGVVLGGFGKNIQVFHCNFDYNGTCAIETISSERLLGYTTWKEETRESGPVRFGSSGTY